MREALFNIIPGWIELKIIHLLDFNSLLNARATCQRWNDIISPLIGERAILNIHMDTSSAAKRFRRGKWKEDLIAPYQEIRVIPKPKNSFLYGRIKGRKTSSLKHFTEVKKFTLFDNGSFPHFVHRYMRHLPNVKYVQLRELPFRGEVSMESRYPYLEQAFLLSMNHFNSWTIALNNVVKVETLRIKLFDRQATLLYMELFAFKMSGLVNIELDFSKFHENPLSRFQLHEVNTILCDLLEHCYVTLKQLRIKWAIRVDTDLDYIRSEEDFEPYFEFLLCLRNPIWMKLKLQQLALTFPTVNLGFTLVDSTLVPFLHSQEYSLRKLSLSRILPNPGMERFVSRFSQVMIKKFDFSFSFIDSDMLLQSGPVTRGIEVLLNSIPTLNFCRMRGRRENALRNYMQLKLINSFGNTNLVKPDLIRLTEWFQNLRVLELLDTSTHGKVHAAFTSGDFNMIVKNLTKLISLKLSNACKLCDAGLTVIPEQRISYMKRIGVYHMPDYSKPPMADAKVLRFLDLRDLSSDLSDASVYFALQHLPKLEKISFHGNHCVTSWGKDLLKFKFRRNPYFDVIFKSNDETVRLGNYALPSADFP